MNPEIRKYSVQLRRLVEEYYQQQMLDRRLPVATKADPRPTEQSLPATRMPAKPTAKFLAGSVDETALMETNGDSMEAWRSSWTR
ncbi:MAG: hypothetical protein MZV65_53380 [Chromatiales bacterium]|nr:hypothetical protein [Chromatiales bacterium]